MARPERQKAYGLKTPLIDILPFPIFRDNAPTTSDTVHDIGQVWVHNNGVTRPVYIFGGINTSNGNAIWSLTAPGASDVDTLTGDTGGVISPVGGNINILGGDGLTVAGAGSTLTINRDALGGYPITPYVVGPVGEAGYQTIQAGINAASGAGGLVFIQPGTYTEDLVLADGVDIVSSSRSLTTIAGTHTPPASGSCSFFGITFTDATAIFSSLVAGTTDIFCDDCAFNVTNGYTFDLLNWTGTIECFDVAPRGTDDGGINNTGGAPLLIFASGLGNGTLNSMVLSGTILSKGCDFNCPTDFQTGASGTFDTSFFTQPITFSNDSAIVISNGRVSGGASAAITMSSSAACTLSNVVVDSSNNPAIAGAGAGTLSIGGCTFLDNGSVAATVTTAFDQTTTGALIGTGAHILDSGTGNNITVKMGDAAGVNKVSFTDSADAEVLSIDSNGALSTLTSLVVAGAFTQTAGAVSISEDNSANAVGIGNGTTARAITLGSSAAAHVITIGSVTGAAALGLNAGTGNFIVTGAATTTMTIGTGLTSGTITLGALANTGTMVLSPSTAIQQIDLGNAAGAKTINIGSGIDGNTIGIGNGVNTTAQTVNIASGASGASSTLNIFNGTATAGIQLLNLGNGEFAKTISIGNGALGNTITMGNGINTVAQNIEIASGASAANSTVSILSGAGTAGVATLALATNSRATTVDLANIAPGAARTVTICGGNSAQNDTLNVMSGNPSANDQTVNIFGGVPSGGTQVLNLLTQTGQLGDVNIGTGLAMANNIKIGGTGACTIGIANDQTAGSLSLGAAMLSATMNIGGLGAHTGGMLIGEGTGAQSIQIGNSTGGKTIAIATGAGPNSVTIGSTNTTSSLTLQAGTGEITVTGTVKEINAEFLEGSGDEITSLSQSPVMTTAANTGGVATGTGGDVNLMYLQQGVLMEQFIIGTQTIIAPRVDTNGLLVSLDLTAAEGAEYNFGAARTNSRHAFTIGTSAAFFFEIGLRINDMDGAAPYVIGFRKSEANNAAMASYTDYASIGMNAASSIVNIVTMDELNGGGQTVTDTTDAWGGDGTTNTLRVLVSAAGVVTYTVNGSAPSAAGAFTFDNLDVVCPYVHVLHSASATAVNITSMKCGFQA